MRKLNATDIKAFAAHIFTPNWCRGLHLDGKAASAHDATTAQAMLRHTGRTDMGSRKTWLRLTASFAALALGMVPALAQTAASPAAAPTGGYERLTTIMLPGKPLLTYDLSFVDPALRLYYLADRTNAGIDVIDTASNRFVMRVVGDSRVGTFAGQQASNDVSGPNGVTSAGFGRVWAGDGDSTIKIIDLFAGTVLKTISTGGTARVDSLVQDPKRHVILAVNDADSPPFVTLLSSRTGDERVLAKISFDNATNGIEGVVYNPRNGLFYVNLPQLGPDQTMGGVAVIDPVTATVVTTFPVSNCQPTGLALGPRRNLLLGCAQSNTDVPVTLATQVIDDFSGAVTATIPQVGGTDQATYDPNAMVYFLAARYQVGGAVLGIIDGRTSTFLGSVPIGKGSHSVAVDPVNNHAFVAEPASATDPACLHGCVAVFGKP